MEMAAQDDIPSLVAAADLWHGEFMEGFYLDGCAEFEIWLIAERERWQQRVTGALQTLVRHYIERGAYQEALRYAARLLALTPWREEAHRQMMWLLAHTGQRSAALTQYEICRRMLAEELDVEPSAETTSLYERIRDAPCSASTLPLQPTSFVGREEELAAIGRRLANPTCRLLTIVGTGGIGKTRLALQAAAQNSFLFLNGTFFVPLAHLSSADHLPSAIADALGFSFHDREEPKVQILQALREKEILLILDNFEHLTEGAGLLVEILETAPAVKLLVTSRERLNLRWEWVFAIEGLPYPVDDRHRTTDDGRSSIVCRPPPAERFSAVRLFIERAQQMEWRFSPREEEPWIARICQLVEGLPLAIELAATWVREQSCQEIAKEIADNLDLLSVTLRDVPVRHRSLRAVLNHSWNLLTEWQREAFRRLSVFSGTFGDEAAMQVAHVSPPDLSALVNKSLLRCDGSERYEMHTLLRQYAAEKLKESPRRAKAIRERHCGYYASFLSQREDQLKGQGQKNALKEIGSQIENVRAAWQRAVDERDVAVIGQALQSLYLFYEIRGWFHEGMQAFERAARALAQTAVGRGSAAHEQGIVLNRLLARQGGLCVRLGLYAYAEELLQTSLAAFRSLDDQEEIAFALNQLGILAQMMGDLPKARQYYRESLALRRRTGDLHGTAMSLNNLGGVAYRIGAYEEARKRVCRGLALCRRIGDRFGSARALNMLGAVADALGEYENARKYYEESLAICHEIEHKQGMAHALNNLGEIAYARANYPEARQFYDQSLALNREMGDLHGIALSLDNLGRVAWRLGDCTEAKRKLRESLTIFREIDDHWGLADALANLGRAYESTGESQRAWDSFRQALRIAMSIEATPLALDILLGVAGLRATGREPLPAVELLSLLLHHPATEQVTRDAAERLLAELAAHLPSPAVASAIDRGKRRSLAEVVEDIVAA
jgi:predicted ATPase